MGTTTLTVRYLDYEEVQVSDDAYGESPQMPRHWWNFNLKIESTANQQVWLTGQTLNITSREHGAQIFPNQMQGKNPRLDAFIQPVYQYNWNLPLHHGKYDAVTAWLRLDGTRMSTNEKQEKFMLLLPGKE